MSAFGYSMPSYFQNMPQLGTPLQTVNEENKKSLQDVETAYNAEVEAALSAGRSDESLNESGQMTARQRLEILVDEGTWCPLDSLYNPGNNKDGSTGVLIGLGKIHDKWAMIIASDNKKLAGAWVPGQALKLTRATDIAKMLRIPLVYVLNCSGVKLDEQEKVYAGRVTGGTPFYRHAELEQMGIPVLVGIYGTNPAGGGYHAISPTILIAHEKANMAVGGAGIVGGMNPKGYVDQEAAEALIDATVKAGKVDPPGAVHIHFGETGFFREVYSGEEGVLAAIKKYMDAIPAYNENFFRVADPMEPVHSGEDLYTRIPFNQKRAYDVREVLACLFDNSEFMEYKKGYGPEIVCGLARVNGLLTGVVTNYQGLLPNYPEYRGAGAVGVGGKLYRQGLIKMNEFVTMCGRDRLPIVWIQDTTGIDVGDPAEKAELLGLGQSLIYSIQNAKVPQMEITLRKGTAAAHYVMGGPQGTERNVFSIGTAATEIYVMHGETAAAAMYARRLVKDKKEGKDLQPTIDKMNKLIQEYSDKSRPAACAKTGLVDEIVELPKLRNYICAFVGASYQNPESICPFHHMMTPRIIRDWNNLMNK
ncbi:acyl-CoA carboxylase subunit beta [uncultured Oscillibacter sp.]|uniref:acyl-CoA carboxylase subunit beta n=1 Tax=uncultured Oscillibacter sp. TaxID=876091 RepID=UPI0025DB24A9|nr:carboxyl transferase domain-containing protein [uncultured Oscillibacter sp.]